MLKLLVFNLNILWNALLIPQKAVFNSDLFEDRK